MKKKFTFFKTLLVAAGLLGGSSAWAGDITTLYGRAVTADTENGYTAWSTDDDVATTATTGKWYATGAGTDPVACNETYGLQMPTAACSYGVTYSNISPTTNAILTYDVVWGFSTGNRDNNYSYIQFGDGIVIKGNGKNQVVNLEVNGNTIQLGRTSTSRWSDELTIHMEVNTFSKKITSLTVTGSLNTTINYTNSDDIEVASDATYTSLKIGTNRGQSTLTCGGYIKSIRVKNETQDVSAVNYTVKFQNTSGTTIKDDAIYTNGVVGEVYFAPSADMATFYNGENTKKYVYKSGQNTETVASSTASENVIILLFDEYEKFNYTVSQKLGDNAATELLSNSLWEDETYTYYYPVCVKSGDDYYTIAANGSTPYYGIIVSLSNAIPTINYTLDKNIVYYAEYEDILSAVAPYSYFDAQSSRGYSKILTGESSMKTALGLTEAGVYDVTIAGGNRDSHTTTMNLKLIDSSDNISEGNVISQYMSGSAWIGEMTASKVTIPAGSELYISNTSGNARFAGDYIIVRKSRISTTITSAGYASFSSTYPLDLDNISGGEAYMVTSNAVNGYVTLTEATGTVAANTGLIIKGDAGTVTIPVAASGTDYSATNKLVAVTTADDVAAGNYILAANKDGSEAGFYLLDEATSLDAGKAYLPASAVSEARARFLFSDDATAIKSIATNAADNAVIYNVAGQRVNAAYKGIVIKNGKKYLNK